MQGSDDVRYFAQNGRASKQDDDEEEAYFICSISY